MSVLGMVETSERAPFARFERRGMEDRNASILEGRYIERDVDHVLVTPPGSRDVFVTVASEWFADLQKQASDGRIPQAWVDRYQDQYKRFKEGEELPLDGTPIKGWSAISPAQQANLVGLRIYTVEDLAVATDEAIRRIGMGALDLKNKAAAWVRQTEDKGAFTQEFAAMKSENAALKEQIKALSEKVGALAVPEATLPDADLREQYFAKFGKKAHHLMKTETIIDALKD